MQWTVLNDSEAVAKKACEKIKAAAEKAIQQRGVFRIVMAGGSTPEKTYRLLAESNCDWQHWQIFFGDERCLPADHPERNSVMVQQVLISKIAIPEEQVFAIPAEQGPIQAAEDYDRTLKKVLPFDLVLLGMGEDGHTASLFPGHKHPADKWVKPVFNAPKPPSERVSLTALALAQSRQLLFLVTGEGKSQAVKQWREGADLPVSHITSLGEVEILIDQAAYESECLPWQ